MGWFTLGAAALGALSSSHSARENRRAAEEGSSQETDLTTEYTLPPWLQSYIEDNLIGRLNAIPSGPIHQALDPRLALVNPDPYSMYAAQSLQNYANSPFFQDSLRLGMGGVANLLGGQNPLLSQAMGMSGMGNQAFAGLMGLAQNNPMLDQQGMLMQNLQTIFNSGFGGGMMGGGQGNRPRGGIDYNAISAMYPSLPNGQPSPQANSAYLDMLASGRDDGFTPWGFTGTNSPRAQIYGNSGPSGTAALLGRGGR